MQYLCIMDKNDLLTILYSYINFEKTLLVLCTFKKLNSLYTINNIMLYSKMSKLASDIY